MSASSGDYLIETSDARVRMAAERLIRGGIPAVLAVIVFLEGLLNLTPPISRDALIQQAIPKLWKPGTSWKSLHIASFRFMNQAVISSTGFGDRACRENPAPGSGHEGYAAGGRGRIK